MESRVGEQQVRGYKGKREAGHTDGERQAGWVLDRTQHELSDAL